MIRKADFYPRFNRRRHSSHTCKYLRPRRCKPANSVLQRTSKPSNRIRTKNIIIAGDNNCALTDKDVKGENSGKALVMKEIEHLASLNNLTDICRDRNHHCRVSYRERLGTNPLIVIMATQYSDSQKEHIELYKITKFGVNQINFERLTTVQKC